ncbi:EAL domain-containing protein [Pseudoalteromonas phenolica]|nr:EAL domain-containing protein [Pseudoalteromonas phenolica]
MKPLFKRVTDTLSKWYLAIASILLVCFLNALLIHLFHLQIHQRGMQFVQQVSLLSEAERTDDKLDTLARQFNLQYVSLGPQRISQMNDLDVFEFANVTLYVKHPKVLQEYASTLLMFNLLFVGLIVFAYRWWLIYQVRPKSFLRQSHRALPVERETVLPSIQQPRSTDESLFNIFALIKWSYHLGESIDAQQHFSIQFQKHFSGYATCSVKYLNSGALAVTIEQVAWGDVSAVSKKMHEVVYQILFAIRGDLSRKVVKLGGCYYQSKSDQTQVYQLARSALSVATNNVWQHIHLTPLNKTHEITMQSSESDFIKYIENGQFILFFQPLFCFATQEITQSEALLRVRHEKLGLIAAKQFVPQLHSKESLWTLDTFIVEHTFKVLDKDKSHLLASVNIHTINWCDPKFANWLLSKLEQSKLANRVLFEMTLDDFCQQRVLLEDIVFKLDIVGTGLVLDQVSESFNVKDLKHIKCIKALKLSFDLVHNIDESHTQQKVVRHIVRQGKQLGLPVYAVGVETQTELQCLQRLGVKGAQGYYFSEPLQQLELAGY